MTIDADRAAEIFAAAADFTVGIEEEFAVLDARSLDLAPRFEELRDTAAAEDPLLSEAIAGELISSEIEIRSGRGEDLADALARQRERRQRLFALAASRGVALGATGTHPWADYREQRNIDTEHYRRVVEGLQYVARRNNTFSVHVHVGVRDAHRAVRVCDRLRPVLPLLLALSANSPFLDGLDSGLHSARSQAFTKSFPRCGIPDAFGSWAAYREYIEFLVRTHSIVEYTQVWWSVRPHFSFGTVEVRICDAQSTAQEAEALTGLIVACVAQAARDEDEGVPFADPSRRLVEENFWRAIRYGLDGTLIDLDRAEEFPAASVADRLLQWTAPMRGELGIDPLFPAVNGAQRQRRALQTGAGMREVYAAAVKETRETYVQEAKAA
ncbi:MAG: glutamate---cysteine ligase / carboxylate-amine ligase [Solirubrobacteraceae bacterium]|jgi:glutamate---cysteine ligase / carboxylate-amine ligase|nr:glutamate---cysteine ligase / carboxylate-amine ligase [Solirubrobacteraceae bacterium]